MSYNLTQQLNHINDNNYDDTISANVSENQFIAVTSNKLQPGAAQREMTVQIMELQGEKPAGESVTNSGLYIRGENETSVKAILLDINGKQVDENVANY